MHASPLYDDCHKRLLASSVPKRMAQLDETCLQRLSQWGFVINNDPLVYRRKPEGHWLGDVFYNAYFES